MATGSQSDIFARIKGILPYGWFGDSTPVLDALITGISTGLAFIYSLIAYTKLQCRIATATDYYLDLTAQDFFGSSLTRNPNESDTAFRARIQSNLLIQKATRQGMISTLTALTGNAPEIFEPWNTHDAFCLGYSGLGSGQMGSNLMPYQAMVIAYLPSGNGFPYMAGLATDYAGLGQGYMGMGDTSLLTQATVTDTAIYAAVDACKVAGTEIWVNIQYE